MLWARPRKLVALGVTSIVGSGEGVGLFGVAGVALALGEVWGVGVGVKGAGVGTLGGRVGKGSVGTRVGKGGVGCAGASAASGSDR